MARYVRIKIEHVLYVDIDQWAAEYGISASSAEVRADVKTYYDTAKLIPEHHTTGNMVMDASTAAVSGIPPWTAL